MKICFLTEDPFHIGGVERVLCSLANGLIEQHNVSILCTKPKVNVDRSIYSLDLRIEVLNPEELWDLDSKYKFRKILRYLNKRILNIRNISFLEYIYFPKSYLEIISKFLNKESFDVVIAVQAKPSFVLGAIKEKINCKCMGWQHNSYDAYFNSPKKYYWRQERLAAKYLNKLDACIVLTDDDVEKYFNKLSVKAIRIYNPVGIKCDIKPLNKNKKLIFVGRLLMEQKGLDYLIQIIKKVFAEINDWELDIVGDGPDKDKLIELIEKNKLKNRVNLCGETKNIEKFYSNASIMLSTSRWEGFGLVLVEAMSYEIPVISFDTSGPHEIIKDDYGILIPKYNVNIFAQNLLDIMNNEDERRVISKYAKERSKYFEIDKIIKEWNEIFYAIIKN